MIRRIRHRNRLFPTDRLRSPPYMLAPLFMHRNSAVFPGRAPRCTAAVKRSPRGATSFAGLLLLLSLVCVLRPAPVQGQASPQVTVHLSSRTVAVGERFTLSIVATHNFQTDILFPEPNPILFGPVEVIERGDVRGRYLGARRPGARIDSVTYTVAAFGADSVRVPSLPVRIVAGPPGARDTLTVGTAPQSVRIVSTLPNDAQGMRGLAPLAAFPEPIWPWILLGLVGAGLLAGGGYAWWRWRYASDESAPSALDADTDTPYERADAHLERLATVDLREPDARRAWYVSLAAVLRQYLAQRLGLDAPKRTTREVVAHLRTHADVPHEATETLQRVLEEADLVKFADMLPAPEAARDAHRDARYAVDRIEHALTHATPSVTPPLTPSADASEAAVPADSRGASPEP